MGPISPLELSALEFPEAEPGHSDLVSDAYGLQQADFLTATEHFIAALEIARGHANIVARVEKNDIDLLRSCGHSSFPRSYGSGRMYSMV